MLLKTIILNNQASIVENKREAGAAADLDMDLTGIGALCGRELTAEDQRETVRHLSRRNCYDYAKPRNDNCVKIETQVTLCGENWQ